MLGRHGRHSDTGCYTLVPAELVPRAAGPFNYPAELVPSPSGELYVADGYRNSRVHRFTSEGELIQSWGEPGKSEANHFHLPHSLIIDGDRIIVCDRENHRIQLFTLNGEFIEFWNDIQRPMDISRDPEGNFLVSEGTVNGSSARISIVDPSGRRAWPASTAAAPDMAAGSTPAATSISPGFPTPSTSTSGRAKTPSTGAPAAPWETGAGRCFTGAPSVRPQPVPDALGGRPGRSSEGESTKNGDRHGNGKGTGAA